ncbi:hypothetical protein [Lutibacter sp.]
MSDKLKSWLLLLLLSSVWGGSFYLINLGLFDEYGNERLPSNELGAFRVTVAFIALTPILFRSFKYLNKQNIPYLIIAGICGNGLPAFLFAYAETTLTRKIHQKVSKLGVNSLSLRC